MATDRWDPILVDRSGESTAVESLHRELQDLGLPPYQARVLAALLCCGTANSMQLAKLSGVPRTSIYQVVEALAAQGLAERLPTIGPAEWSCPGWEVALESLAAAGEERLRQYRAQLERLRRTMVARLPPTRLAEPVRGAGDA